MTTKRKTTSDRVPPEIAYVLQHGKLAYRQHPSWGSPTGPDDQCANIYVICGKVIQDSNFGAQLWQEYRSELMKRRDVKTFWAYSMFEEVKQPCAAHHRASGSGNGAEADSESAELSQPGARGCSPWPPATQTTAP